jgi:hypothetical protein
MHYVNDINLVPKMGQIIKVQRPVSPASINGLYHRPLISSQRTTDDGRQVMAKAHIAFGKVS